MTRWRLRTEKMMLRAKQRRRWRCDYSWFICSSDFCNFSHLCLRGVCMCVRKRENKRVNKSTDVWARLLWLSLCLGLLLWLLGGASPADGTVGHGSTKLSVPQLHPWFLWTHSFELCMCLHRVLGRKKTVHPSVKYRIYPHPSRARPFTLHYPLYPIPLLTFYAVHPTHCSWAYWSIPEVVMVV